MSIYVVHKHTASRLHYDLRLQMDGVLKSWAIPKQPPEGEDVKRLAIAVEDHQIGYEKFEGVIPKGEYGAGKVEIWDNGTFEILEKEKGKLVIKISGKRLKGAYCLIKLKPKVASDKNWLFFRKKS